MKLWIHKDEALRLKQIAHVLLENHLGFIITRLKLRQWVPFTRRLETERFKHVELNPKLILKVFEDLDGSFIKLGQLLALRPDLIPAEYCDELAKLQDKVKPFPGKKAKEIIEKELGKPIGRLFASFDEKPIAAASMGQVHVAKLKDGRKVAVKVQRPDVLKTVKIDIKLLYRLASALQKRYKIKTFDAVEIVREFERYTDNELNYLKEAHNIDLFHQNFAKSDAIVVPAVHWSHTTGKVLTMEYIAGRRLTDVSRFKPAQRKKIMNAILDAEFEQMFVHGVFHADPHPGNYLIKRNGKIALLDFGIIGRLDYVLKDTITNFFISVVNGDVEGVINEALKMGVTTDDSDVQQIRRDLYDYLSGYYGTPLEKMNVTEVMQTLIRIFRQNKLKLPPSFVLLVKATVTLEGFATRLDPKMNFVESAKPYVKKLTRRRMHPARIAKRAKKKVEMMLEFAESIPKKTSTLLSELHGTGRDLRRIDKDISSLTVEMDRSSNRLTLGFLAGTLFIASTMMLPYGTALMFGMPALSFIGYIMALLITISIFVSITREKKI
ncbi:AarF/ABC1/UbiB kinase family protein [Candidatus Woesearchaeota archaeon]|jgi:ubiquinone biosynthesis protein|nr:AarF/ABC1/UbiB kinase family protein [Candidatus Woesearchaeota archaeon]